jgi:hypothetical protein
MRLKEGWRALHPGISEQDARLGCDLSDALTNVLSVMVVGVPYYITPRFVSPSTLSPEFRTVF